MSNEFRLPILAMLYRRYLVNQDSAAFIRKVSQAYTPGTLERLAEHRTPEVRRGAVLALGFLGSYDSNDTMGRALTDSDRTVRILAENGIRNLWNHAGTLEECRALAIVIRLNVAQQYRRAEQKATRLIEKSPWFAEAWNQRAVAHFALGEFDEAIHDCHQALELNPYHFAAAAGIGQAYLHVGNHVAALDGFRRALRLNPNLEGARAQIARLTKLIGDK